MKKKSTKGRQKPEPYFSNRLTGILTGMIDSVYDKDHDTLHVYVGRLIELIQLTKEAHKRGKNVTVIASGKIYNEGGEII